MGVGSSFNWLLYTHNERLDYKRAPLGLGGPQGCMLGHLVATFTYYCVGLGQKIYAHNVSYWNIVFYIHEQRSLRFDESLKQPSMFIALFKTLFANK